jgi:replicative DNA helicase|tara:strand:+ start:1163 stop:2530 length:1368 start_codon:yes stop_codon:yes gene_type:complete
MSETLTQFGTSFQSKIIASLMGNVKFIQTISDILNPSMFDSDSNKWLVKSIKEYYYEYKKQPTLEVIKYKIDEIDDDVLKSGVVDKLREVWKNIEATDLEFVQSETLDFCKNQTLKSAILESVDLLENKNYDGIKSIIDEAMKAGTTRDLGQDYIESLQLRLEESARITINTPWDVVNDIMDGGLGVGELGVIVAPAGIGKSWTLQALGAGALKDGKTVVHYTLELNENYVGLRYDSIFSGVTTANIKYYKDDVQAKISKLPGKLLIKYFPTKSASVQTIGAHLKQIEISGVKPDIVLVDYADILMSVGTFREKRHALGTIYEDLRGLAGELEVPIWTASQANRSALEEDVIGADKVAEDYSKVMTADFVMSMSRKVEDKIANTGRFHVIKNRFGIDGVTYPATINTNIGQVQIFEGSSQFGKDAQSKMNNSQEFLRKELANKYNDMEKNVEGFE